MINFLLSLMLFFFCIGCSSSPLSPRLPETQGYTQIPTNPDRSREVAALLDGHFQRAEGCAGLRRLTIQDGRVEFVEGLAADVGCDGGLRGQVVYRGRIKVGELMVSDGASRPLSIVIDEVEIQALVEGWGIPRGAADPCSLRDFNQGESRLMTGQDCGVWGRFPAEGEVFQSHIVINSGQRIQFKDFPSMRNGSAIERRPATANSNLDFERTTL